MRISIHARLRSLSAMSTIVQTRVYTTHFMPIQFLDPMLKGLSTDLQSSRNSAGGFFSQRSGRNSAGRWKLLVDRFAAHRFIVTLVCGGTILPATMAASSIVERKSMSGAGGYKRRLSCSTALRYSCCSNLAYVKLSVDAKSALIAAVNFSSARGLLTSKYTAPDSSVAAEGSISLRMTVGRGGILTGL